VLPKLERVSQSFGLPATWLGAFENAYNVVDDPNRHCARSSPPGGHNTMSAAESIAFADPNDSEARHRTLSFDTSDAFSSLIAGNSDSSLHTHGGGTDGSAAVWIAQSPQFDHSNADDFLPNEGKGTGTESTQTMCGDNTWMRDMDAASVSLDTHCDLVHAYVVQASLWCQSITLAAVHSCCLPK